MFSRSSLYSCDKTADKVVDSVEDDLHDGDVIETDLERTLNLIEFKRRGQGNLKQCKHNASLEVRVQKLEKNQFEIQLLFPSLMLIEACVTSGTL